MEHALTPDEIRFEEAERELIKLSGIPCETQRIPIGESHSYSIFCLKCGSDSNPPLILLHGYLGTSIIFIKILPRLSQHFKVYCLDLMGMGKSSRPEFTATNTEEAELFFIIPLEMCRAALNIEKMTLAGHSFGGYVAGCYTESFPQHVEKLILISPMGVPRAPYVSGPEWLKGFNWKIRTFNRIAKYFLRKNITPASILRKLGPFRAPIIRRYLRHRWRRLSPEEMSHFEVYLQQVNIYPGSGEYAVKDFLKEGGYAVKPICDRIKSTKVLYVYGDHDFMDPVGAEMNAEVNQKRIEVEFISRSGHHMYIDNPAELCEKLLRGLRNLDCDD